MLVSSTLEGRWITNSTREGFTVRLLSGFRCHVDSISKAEFSIRHTTNPLLTASTRSALSSPFATVIPTGSDSNKTTEAHTEVNKGARPLFTSVSLPLWFYFGATVDELVVPCAFVNLTVIP